MPNQSFVKQALTFFFLLAVLTAPHVYSATPLTALNGETRDSVVNVFCTTGGKEIQPLSGSGVIIDERGVVLTAAHVAQYFLLPPNTIDCLIRTGSPATASYRAEIMYISPKWVRENASLIDDPDPLGTGENDFALLRITGSLDGSSLPEKFPFRSPDTDDSIEKDAPLLLAAYPAGFLGSILMHDYLYLISTVTTVKEKLVFEESRSGNVDIISLGGVIVAQKGSSGGAVVAESGKLVAIIVTSTEAPQTSERDLRAITLSHINRNLIADKNVSLSSFLGGNLSQKAEEFRSGEFTRLAALITDALVD